MNVPRGHEQGHGGTPLRWTAAGLSAALGSPHAPTAEQADIIEAPLRPQVVVAGAGSGKTETMAARVVWIVANGLARPDQVLGLTFTRKAARELAARVRRQLDRLRVQGLLPGEPGESPGEVTVLTYDAYAQRIVADHGLRAGREPGLRLVTDAIRWQLATRVVGGYAGPMETVDNAASTVVGHVLALHAELSGHLVPLSAVEEFTGELVAGIESLPRAGRQQTKEALYAEVKSAIARQRSRLQILPLVEEFRAELRRREMTDFGQQAELAAHLATAFPEVARGERAKYSLVLLDEYQDTSHSQLVLLRALFAGHPVTAVGDPCQSIYGWRGASARTLGAFARHFAGPAEDDVSQRNLATSFRNGARILDVANRLAGPLREEGLDVLRLTSSPARGRGTVEASVHVTVIDEARHLAGQLKALWDADAPRRAEGRPARTMAVLVRKRSQIPLLREHLVGAGLPVEVVGVGGLLTVPEVADVVATLRVLSDPGRGDALIRLLAGSRWRVGPRDLEALGRWARHQARGGDDPAWKDDGGGASVVDALDELPPPGWLSVEGRLRMQRLAEELRRLRRRMGESVPDLVASVVVTLGLDVEVMARSGRSSARADLDAFLDVASAFVQFGDEPTLPAFLNYLDAAAAEERGLERGEIEVSGDRVQLLTVHGAKGLEWDVVAVPGLVQGVFPAGDESGTWLTNAGVVPYPLRGDAEALPDFAWRSTADQKAVMAALTSFREDCSARGELEERRLAYVAVTRAREVLLCSGYTWDHTRRARTPAPFLIEVMDVCREFGGIPLVAPRPADDAVNPLLADGPRSAVWPVDPLGPARRVVVEGGADLVRRSDGSAVEDSPWRGEIDLLLAERESRAAGGGASVAVPRTLSASALTGLARDPSRFVRAMRRPMPRPPNPQARAGTAFHAWVERHYGIPGLLDIDELPGSADDSAPAHPDVGSLREAFLASAWAARTPVEIESPFELPLGPVLVRGRVDAVFTASGDGLDVVDWKTGPPPLDPTDLAAKSVQLAVYRLAFARLHGLPIDRVGAAFHHVRENVTLRPVDLLDENGLIALVGTLANGAPA